MQNLQSPIDSAAARRSTADDRPRSSADRSEADLIFVQRELKRALGPELLRALHRPRPILDVTAMAAVYAIAIAMVYSLGQLSFGPLWVLCLVVQGLALMLMGLINHELFVHRRFGHRRGSFWLSLLYTVPLAIDNVGYHDAHHRHHRFIGTHRDGEGYKQLLSTRLRRLLFCTAIGVRRAMKSGYFEVARPGLETRRNQRIERWTKAAFFAALTALAVWYPRHVVFGYLVPLVLVLPVLNSLRVIIEHADADPANPYALATFYRTGPLTRVLCLWDSGDCHLIHHVFPNIPFYHMSAAVRAMRPILLARGVIERTSYLELLLGWFWHNHHHRTRWPLT